jgi:16S rRNA (guanine966-N2)-methyltransferase
MRRGALTVTIGGGTLRGRVLRYPDGPGLRPSMQRTKSSLFSSLVQSLEGSTFVDLFAGAGAVGIEALSRGARFVHFVERDRVALEALRANLATCRIEAGRFFVHGESVARILDARPCPIANATIVFADPPYDADLDEALARHVSTDALPELEWLVVERQTRAIITAPADMIRERERRFGETTVSYFVLDEERKHGG